MGASEVRRAGLALALAFVVAVIAFTVWPGVDLQVSALFYRPATAFPLAQLPALEAFRNVIWDLTIVTFVVAVAGAGLALAGRPLIGVPLRDWAYIAVLYLLGPILLVNMTLKAHWGRARPADVTEFGGALRFTPPWPPAEQCLSNCSFVSGEVSATVVMAIAMLALRPALARYLPKAALRLWAGMAFVLPVMVAVQRIATGRHFLSDTVFAALFMLALALVLLPVRGADGARRR